MAEKSTPIEEHFDWIQLSKDVQTHRNEEFSEKFLRKFMANPLVPIGALGACGALSFGLFSMLKGDQELSQRMMRLRIGSQGFCIATLIGGLVYAKESRKWTKDDTSHEN